MNILVPVPRREWREPSQRQCIYGIENRTWFCLQARASDGSLFWRGWFEDRDEADRFLWAMATGDLRWDRFLRRSPLLSRGHHIGWFGSFHIPLYEGEWFPEWIDLPLRYEFSGTTFITSPTGSNQNFTSQSDWNNSRNRVVCIGGGGSGGVIVGSSSHATGGGASNWALITNFVFANPGTTVAIVRVGAQGTGVTQSGTGSSAGHDGGQTWFNTATDPGVSGFDNSKCSADGGLAGAAGAGAQLGGQPGFHVWGNSFANGGNGGDLSGASGLGASGAGGAGGPNGDGAHGITSSATTTVATNGGDGDVGAGPTFGGAGTIGNTTGSSTGDAGNGPEYTSDLMAIGGSGGGSGGIANTVAGTITSGNGGNYGGASGGAANASASGVAVSGNGAQGIIVLMNMLSATPPTGFISWYYDES